MGRKRPQNRWKTAEERYNHWISQVIRSISLKHHHLERKNVMMNWCAHVLLTRWLLLQPPYRFFSRLISWSLVNLNQWNSEVKVGIVRPSPSPVIIPSFHHPQPTRLAILAKGAACRGKLRVTFSSQTKKTRSIIIPSQWTVNLEMLHASGAKHQQVGHVLLSIDLEIPLNRNSTISDPNPIFTQKAY